MALRSDVKTAISPCMASQITFSLDITFLGHVLILSGSLSMLHRPSEWRIFRITVNLAQASDGSAASRMQVLWDPADVTNSVAGWRWSSDIRRDGLPLSGWPTITGRSIAQHDASVHDYLSTQCHSMRRLQAKVCHCALLMPAQADRRKQEDKEKPLKSHGEEKRVFLAVVYSGIGSMQSMDIDRSTRSRKWIPLLYAVLIPSLHAAIFWHVNTPSCPLSFSIIRPAVSVLLWFSVIRTTFSPWYPI